MDETIVRKLDDVEHKKGHKYDATHHGIELEFEGVRVSLDLGDANYGTIKEAVTPYLEAGQKISGRNASGGGSTTRRSTRRSSGEGSGSRSSAKDDDQTSRFNREVRRWVREERPDLKISDKGRIADAVLAEYKREHPDWEKDYFMGTADDSAPAAPQPTQSQADYQPAHAAPQPEGQYDDEHGWARETPGTYTGVGTYS